MKPRILWGLIESRVAPSRGPLYSHFRSFVTIPLHHRRIHPLKHLVRVGWLQGQTSGTSCPGAIDSEPLEPGPISVFAAPFHRSPSAWLVPKHGDVVAGACSQPPVNRGSPAEACGCVCLLRPMGWSWVFSEGWLVPQPNAGTVPNRSILSSQAP